VDDTRAQQIEEYLHFSRLTAENRQNQDLVCDWLRSLYTTLGRSESQDTQIAEALQIALLTANENIFLGKAKLLADMSDSLLHAIDKPMEFTRESYNKHGAAFLALQHAIITLYNISGMLLDPNPPDGTYQTFMRRLEGIEQESSAYYPFRYQSKVIVQDLKSLEAGELHHGTLHCSVMKMLQCVSDIPESAGDPVKTNITSIACQALRETFQDVDIPDMWYEVIKALHCISVRVFRRPQLYSAAEVVFDALCTNNTYIFDKETRMAVRW